MTGVHHHTDLFPLRWRSYKLFCQDWPRITILPISVSHAAGITDMYHHVQPLVKMGGISQFFDQAGLEPQSS
jgi:hypothetical protein